MVVGLTLRALVGYPAIRAVHWEALVAIGVLRHPLRHGISRCPIATILILRWVAPAIPATIAGTVSPTIPKLLTLQQGGGYLQLLCSTGLRIPNMLEYAMSRLLSNEDAKNMGKFRGELV